MRMFLVLLCTVALARGASPEADAERLRVRIKSQNTALTLFPEVADPRSRIGAEVERIAAEYEAAKDDVIFRDDAPLILTQRAADRVLASITVEESEKDALRLFPDLALSDSPLKKLFEQRRDERRKTNPAAFANTRWPVLLAFECAVALDPSRLPGAEPSAAPGAPASADPAPPAAPAPLPAVPPAPAEAPRAAAAPAAKPAVPTGPPNLQPPVEAPPPAGVAKVPADPVRPAAAPVNPPSPTRSPRRALIGADDPSPIAEAPPPVPAAPDPTVPAVEPPLPTNPSPPDLAPTPPLPPELPVAPITTLDPTPAKPARRSTENLAWSKTKAQIGPYVTATLALASLAVFAAAWWKRQRE